LKRLLTLLKKELLMHQRNHSLIWIPIVFILLAIMDPITTYFLPVILENVGGMPEGMTFDIPAVPASEAFGLSLSELSMFGVLITILLTASSISQERQTGVSELLLVKPINASHYIGSKALAKMVVFTGAIVISLLFSWYYVTILFGSLPLIYMILAIIFYSCWFIFVISLTLTYAAVIRQQYMIVGVTVLTLATGSIINGIFHHKIPWFYNNLSALIVEMLQTKAVTTDLLLNIGLLLVTSLALLLLSFSLFERKERL